MRTNLLDRAILWLSPERGAARIEARARASVAARRATMLESVYDGATHSYRNSSRRYRPGDANSTLIHAARRLRFAARDLERNNPIAQRGFSVLTSNVIGAGIVPSVTTPRGGNRSLTALQQLLKSHCDTPKIDAAGRQNLYGLQTVAFRAAVRDGESLMVRRLALASEGLPLPFQVAVLEADYIDDRVNGVQPNGNLAVQGIEFDRKGEAVTYHLYDHHPGDLTIYTALNSRPYPAADVVHLYRIDRPGQARGVSWIAPVIVRLGDFEDTKEAYVMRQKIAACFAAFITKVDAAGNPVDQETTPNGSPIETVEPGMIEHLGPGESVTFGTPPVVGDLEAFFRVNARDIAVGLGMTYEALTGDLSNVNFSSGRMGWLEFHRNIGAWTWQMVLPQMCSKLGQWLLDGLMLMAVVPTGATIEWTPPRREMIDPASELKAAAQAARDGLGTRSMWLRGMGYDPETIDTDRATELQREATLGLLYDTNTSAEVAAKVRTAPQPTPEQTAPNSQEVDQ